MEMELYELAAEIDRIATNTQFNGVDLLNGGFSVSGAAAETLFRSPSGSLPLRQSDVIGKQILSTTLDLIRVAQSLM